MPEYAGQHTAATTINAFLSNYHQLKDAYPNDLIEIIDSNGHIVKDIKKAGVDLIELTLQSDNTLTINSRYIHTHQFDLTIRLHR